jgi:hypothetical protein
MKGGIQSYVSNLSVDAYVYQWDDTAKGYVQARTLVSGGYSSKIGISGLGTFTYRDVGVAHPTKVYDQVCEGPARPVL